MRPHDQFEDVMPPRRPQWGEEAAVVVPKTETAKRISGMIDAGSGIVACGVENMPDKVLVYYEGNRMGASNMQTLEDRTMNAYGRMSKRYPTIAMAMMDRSDFDVVGTISPDRFDIDTQHPALQAWVAHDPRLMESPERAFRVPRMR